MTAITATASPAPSLTALTANGGLAGTGIHLSWTIPQESTYWGAEIWVSTTNNRANAVSVEAQPILGSSYVYALGTPKTVYYFWIRSANIYKIKNGAWLPVSATGGLTVTHGAVEVLHLATNLSDAIAASGTFINTTYPADKTETQTQLDGKVESWFQTSDPSLNWVATTTPLRTAAQVKALHTGDTWFNSTAATKKLYRYNGTAWEVIEDKTALDAYTTASTAQSTADGKVNFFTVQPTNYRIGDLWDDGGSPVRSLRVSTLARATYLATDWTVAATKNQSDATTNSAITTAGTTANYASVTGTPTSLSGINSTESTKLTGIQLGATANRSDALINADIATAGTTASWSLVSGISVIGGQIANDAITKTKIGANAVSYTDRQQSIRVVAPATPALATFSFTTHGSSGTNSTNVLLWVKFNFALSVTSSEFTLRSGSITGTVLDRCTVNYGVTGAVGTAWLIYNFNETTAGANTFAVTASNSAVFERIVFSILEVQK